MTVVKILGNARDDFKHYPYDKLFADVVLKKTITHLRFCDPVSIMVLTNKNKVGDKVI